MEKKTLSAQQHMTSIGATPVLPMLKESQAILASNNNDVYRVFQIAICNPLHAPIT